MPAPHTAVLQIHCPDQSGIVALITQILFEKGANILDAQQHREELDNQFFMYVQFEQQNLNCSHDQLRETLKEKALEYDMKWSLSFSDEPKNMAIMVSKYDHCLYDLLLRHKYGEFPSTNIALIVSNHPDLGKVAEHFDIPFQVIPKNKDIRIEADQKALETFKEYDIDLIVMARYMQIVTPVLLDAYPNHIINVHHGFLPAFKGAKPYHQAYEKGVKLIGATSHYATVDLDMGPMIEQETERINHGYSVDDMIRLGRSIENKVLANAVKAHCEDRIIVYKNRTIIFN